MKNINNWEEIRNLGNPADCGMLAHCGQCLIKEDRICPCCNGTCTILNEDGERVYCDLCAGGGII